MIKETLSYETFSFTTLIATRQRITAIIAPHLGQRTEGPLPHGESRAWHAACSPSHVFPCSNWGAMGFVEIWNRGQMCRVMAIIKGMELTGNISEALAVKNRDIGMREGRWLNLKLLCSWLGVRILEDGTREHVRRGTASKTELVTVLATITRQRHLVAVKTKSWISTRTETVC